MISAYCETDSTCWWVVPCIPSVFCGFSSWPLRYFPGTDPTYDPVEA